VFNNFIKMKILSSFDDFFVEPYKHSSMARFIGVSIPIDRFRKDKIFITKAEIMSLELQDEEPKKVEEKPKAPTQEEKVAKLGDQVEKLVKSMEYEHKKSVAQQVMIQALYNSLTKGYSELESIPIKAIRNQKLDKEDLDEA